MRGTTYLTVFMGLVTVVFQCGLRTLDFSCFSRDAGFTVLFGFKD